MLKALNKYPQCISKHANYFFMLGCVLLQCNALIKDFSVSVAFPTFKFIGFPNLPFKPFNVWRNTL